LSGGDICCEDGEEEKEEADAEVTNVSSALKETAEDGERE
jgi:hypothetical protein